MYANRTTDAVKYEWVPICIYGLIISVICLKHAPGDVYAD